jgi:hypothetical protein
VGAHTRPGERAAPTAPAPLVAAVQHNCHIADARHAADLSLCSFLLQMREFYRWEQGLPLGAPLPRQAVGAWLAERERQWSRIEDDAFAPLPHPTDAGASFDAFDADALGPHLAPLGLAYGAALAARERPGFFLAELLHTRELGDGLTLQVCGREHARGLFAPPAALLGDTVVLRRESMARWVWEKFEAFALRRVDGPFKAVVEAYALDADFVRALPRLLDEQGETLVLHEIGEHRVGRRWGGAWAAMRLDLDDRRTDLQVRAVRDLVADLEVTLPTLLAQGAAPSLHFWFASFDGVRAALCPALLPAYRAWCEGDHGRALRAVAARARDHFDALAGALLALHAERGDAAGAAIAERLGAPQAVCTA